MSKVADILARTVISNPLPILVRGTTSINTDIFIKLKDYFIMCPYGSSVFYLIKNVGGILKTVKTIPVGKYTTNYPYPLGNSNAFVTKDCENCSITLNFIDPETDNITQVPICVSTATDNTRASYAIDVIDTTIYVICMESSSCFLYTGPVNFVTRTAVFTKATVKTVAASSGINSIKSFLMITPTTFAGCSVVNGAATTSSANGFFGDYSISGTSISSKNNPITVDFLTNSTASIPQMRTTNGVWVYNIYNLYYLDNSSTTQNTAALAANAANINTAVITMSGVLAEANYINFGPTDGFYYCLKDGKQFDQITVYNMIPQSVAKTGYSGEHKYGPILGDVLFVKDPYNAYNYVGMPIKFENNILSPTVKRVKAYTNETGKTQYITGVMISSMRHQIDLQYTSANNTQFRNCVGIAINDVTLYRSDFEQADVKTFANCPITLHAGDTVYLEVVSCYGDVSLTLTGIIESGTSSGGGLVIDQPGSGGSVGYNYYLNTNNATCVTVYSYDPSKSPALTELANGAILRTGDKLRFVTKVPEGLAITEFKINGEDWDWTVADNTFTVEFENVTITVSTKVAV